MNDTKCELYHDNFQNFKRYDIPKAQLVIADIPYNLGVNAYASNPTRCGDCKHYKNYGKTSLFVNGKNVMCGWCHRRIRYDEEHRMLKDDFCSYGEREETK